jgi:hypothetical protein
MTPTNSILMGDWMKLHGVDRRRIENCTVDHEGLRYYSNGDAKNGYAPGDLIGGLVTHSDWSGWTFGLDLSGSGGILSLKVSLDTDARNRGETITVRRLRDAPLADLALAIRTAFAMEFWDQGLGDPGMPVRKREAGPTPVSELELARAMSVYVAAVADGHSTQKAAERFNVSKATMDNYRNRAKRQGLFITHGRGKPGGMLTPKAWALLKEDGK